MTLRQLRITFYLKTFLTGNPPGGSCLPDLYPNNMPALLSNTLLTDYIVHRVSISLVPPLLLTLHRPGFSRLH